MVFSTPLRVPGISRRPYSRYIEHHANGVLNPCWVEPSAYDTFSSSTNVSIGGNGLVYPSTCLYHSEQHHGLWGFNKYIKLYIV